MYDSRLAYTAGFIEADGCFQITNTSIGVRVTNAHLPTLRRFIEWHGGNLSSKVTPSNCWDWNLHGEAAANLCERLLPFLFMKQEAAQCLIDFYATIQPRGKKVSEEVRAIRDELRAKLKTTREYRNVES